MFVFFLLLLTHFSKVSLLLDWLLIVFYMLRRQQNRFQVYSKLLSILINFYLKFWLNRITLSSKITTLTVVFPGVSSDTKGLWMNFSFIVFTLGLSGFNWFEGYKKAMRLYTVPRFYWVPDERARNPKTLKIFVYYPCENALLLFQNLIFIKT